MLLESLAALWTRQALVAVKFLQKQVAENVMNIDVAVQNFQCTEINAQRYE
jgi:hypothetical protein